MVKDADFGHLTTSPGLVGTGLQICARMKLPFLGSEPMFRQELCQQHDLLCHQLPVRGQITKSTYHFEVSNKHKFGLSESDIYHEFVRGVQEIIDIESRYKQP